MLPASGGMVRLRVWRQGRCASICGGASRLEVHDLLPDADQVARLMLRARPQRAGDVSPPPGLLRELGKFPGVFDSDRDSFELPRRAGLTVTRNHGVFAAGCVSHAFSIALDAREIKRRFNLPDRRATLSMAPVLFTAKRSREGEGGVNL